MSDLQAEIQAQRERVDLAWAMWQQTPDDSPFEQANWLYWQAQNERLNALYKMAKAEAGCVVA